MSCLNIQTFLGAHSLLASHTPQHTRAHTFSISQSTACAVAFPPAARLFTVDEDEDQEAHCHVEIEGSRIEMEVQKSEIEQNMHTVSSFHLSYPCHATYL